MVAEDGCSTAPAPPPAARRPEVDEVSSASQLRLAFSGAGLHGFYFNGVSRYIVEQEIEVREAWGASAGALAALSTLMQVGPEAYEEVFDMYDRNYLSMPWMFWHGRDFVWDSPSGGLRKYMPKGIRAERAWLREVVNGRLHVVVTRLGNFRMERVVVSSWESVEDLVTCIRATMTIPGVTAIRPVRWRGSLWVDGSFTNLHPSTDKTLLISTSVPVQPWAASWHHHVGIFRPLPVRMSWWHCPVSERRDMFKLGYMDAKAYFESQAAEPPSPRSSLMTPSGRHAAGAGPLGFRPAVRAALFVSNLALELLQGSFLLVLTGGFVWRRRDLWRSLLPMLLRHHSGGELAGGRGVVKREATSGARATARKWAMRLGLSAELVGFLVLSLLMWCVAVDLRVDLSDFLLNLAAGSKQVLWRSASFAKLGTLKEEKGRPADADIAAGDTTLAETEANPMEEASPPPPGRHGTALVLLPALRRAVVGSSARARRCNVGGHGSASSRASLA